MSTTTTGPAYRYHGTDANVFGSTVYAVRRADETEPFATVVKTFEGRGWGDKARWEARAIADEEVKGGGDSRESAVKSLEWNLLTPEERQRRTDEGNARWAAEREEIDQRIAQRKLDELRTPEHQAEALIEAFHVLFDIKDAGDASRIADHKARAAWTAIQALDNLMREAAIARPRRYDNDGRTSENGGV